MALLSEGKSRQRLSTSMALSLVCSLLIKKIASVADLTICTRDKIFFVNHCYAPPALPPVFPYFPIYLLILHLHFPLYCLISHLRQTAPHRLRDVREVFGRQDGHSQRQDAMRTLGRAAATACEVRRQMPQPFPSHGGRACIDRYFRREVSDVCHGRRDCVLLPCAVVHAVPGECVCLTCFLAQHHSTMSKRNQRRQNWPRPWGSLDDRRLTFVLAAEICFQPAEPRICIGAVWVLCGFSPRKGGKKLESKSRALLASRDVCK